MLWTTSGVPAVGWVPLPGRGIVACTEPSVAGRDGRVTGAGRGGGVTDTGGSTLPLAGRLTGGATVTRTGGLAGVPGRVIVIGPLPPPTVIVPPPGRRGDEGSTPMVVDPGGRVAVRDPAGVAALTLTPAPVAVAPAPATGLVTLPLMSGPGVVCTCSPPTGVVPWRERAGSLGDSDAATRRGGVVTAAAIGAVLTATVTGAVPAATPDGVVLTVAGAPETADGTSGGTEGGVASVVVTAWVVVVTAEAALVIALDAEPAGLDGPAAGGLAAAADPLAGDEGAPAVVPAVVEAAVVTAAPAAGDEEIEGDEPVVLVPPVLPLWPGVVLLEIGALVVMVVAAPEAPLLVVPPALPGA